MGQTVDNVREVEKQVLLLLKIDNLTFAQKARSVQKAFFPPDDLHTTDLT